MKVSFMLDATLGALYTDIYIYIYMYAFSIVGANWQEIMTLAECKDLGNLGDVKNENCSFA